jgi:hypothetical protein
MRLIYTISLILLSAFTLQAQNLSGVWRGTFEQNNLNPIVGRFSQDSYKYEVQINDKKDGSIEGVTYSYLTTLFYGKASLKGRFDKKNKIITIKETFLIEVKSTGKTDPCLMTCYLDYRKDGKLETLIGTYTSVNMNTKKDCGDGIVYLEKVEESDFEREDFLALTTKENKLNTPRKLPSGKNFEADRIAEAKKNDATKKKPPIAKKAIVQNAKPIAPKVSNSTPLANSNITSKSNSIAKNKISTNKQLIKANNNTSSIKQKINKPKNQNIITKKDNLDSVAVTIIPEPKKEPKVEQSSAKIILPASIDVLTDRENKLANKVYVDAKEIIIEFYDNGEVDNDTISVYKDNQLVINRGRLSTKPIVLTLKFDDVNTFYELITVAENLGDIPPNTALMVINYGRKREEIFLTSDEKRNAKVIIEYKAK